MRSVEARGWANNEPELVEHREECGCSEEQTRVEAIAVVAGDGLIAHADDLVARMVRHLDDRKGRVVGAYNHARREVADAGLHVPADLARLQHLGRDVRHAVRDKLRHRHLVDVGQRELVHVVVTVVGVTLLDLHLQAFGRRLEQDGPGALRCDHDVTRVTQAHEGGHAGHGRGAQFGEQGGRGGHGHPPNG